MKKREKNRDIEELFRKHFSEFEIEPSAQFRKMFDRRLSAREFLRFNPARFNIFYLTATIATGIIAATLLFSAPSENTTAPDVIITTGGSGKQPKSVIKTEDHVNDPNNSYIKGSREASGRITSVNQNEKSGAATRDSGGKIIKEVSIKEPLNTKTEGAILSNQLPETGKLVNPSPKSLFKASSTEGCLPLTVNFTNQSTNWDSCLWEFGDGGYSTIVNPVWVFDQEGDYVVTLVTFGAGDQEAVTRQTITAYPRPQARFEISSGDIVIPEEEVMFYNYSTNSVSWEWSFGDGAKSTSFEPAHSYSSPGSYTVTLVARSEYGCADSMSVTNAFDDNSCYIRFPNAFIPNQGGPTGGYYSNRSDEQEEVFHPVWSGVTQYQLRIFSRMGILVFETNDIDIGWDGYIKGKNAEPGVYIWKVRGQFKNGDPFVQTGDVTILPKR